jgi:hypothetical protein
VLGELGGDLDLEHVFRLPRGLSGLYQDWFARSVPVDTQEQLEDYRQGVRPALAVIAAELAPLRNTELTQVLGWDESQLKDFQDATGALFPVENDCIRPCHSSLLDWLTAPAQEEPGSRVPPAGLHQVPVQAGHRLLAEWGWKDYQTWKDAPDIHSMSPYARAYLPLHLVRVHEWDRFEEIMQDGGFVSQACETGYLWWYCFERGEWQTALMDWLRHLFETNSERARLAAATAYLNEFWWWGERIESAFCKMVLEVLRHRCQAPPVHPQDQQLLVALQQFDSSYPKKEDFRSRAGAVERWQQTVGALRDLGECMHCLGNVTELGGDRQRLHLSMLLDIYLGEAYQWRDAEAAERYTIQALGKLQHISKELDVTQDNWIESWIQWQLAEIHWEQHRDGDALAGCQHALGAVERPDHEVTANIYRTMGEVVQARGEQKVALICYRLAMWYAYRFQGEPHEPDRYTFSYIWEMRERWLDWAVAAAQTDADSVAAECQEIRKLWLPSTRRSLPAEGQVEKAEVVRWLSIEDRDQLAEYALPRLPATGDREYVEVVQDAARHNEQKIAAWERTVAEHIESE